MRVVKVGIEGGTRERMTFPYPGAAIEDAKGDLGIVREVGGILGRGRGSSSPSLNSGLERGMLDHIVGLDYLYSTGVLWRTIVPVLVNEARRAVVCCPKLMKRDVVDSPMGKLIGLGFIIISCLIGNTAHIDVTGCNLYLNLI